MAGHVEGLVLQADIERLPTLWVCNVKPLLTVKPRRSEPQYFYFCGTQVRSLSFIYLYVKDDEELATYTILCVTSKSMTKTLREQDLVACCEARLNHRLFVQLGNTRAGRRRSGVVAGLGAPTVLYCGPFKVPPSRSGRGAGQRLV